MTESIITLVVDNLLEIIFGVISLVISAYVIPAIKNDLVPWLKDKRIYNTVKKFVQAAEKLAESGAIEKVNKKQEVIKLLEKQGIVVDEKISAFIESAVKEVDLIGSAIRDEIMKEEENTEAE